MCALVTIFGLALAATSAVLVVMAVVNGNVTGKLSAQANSTAGNSNYTALLDPDGPDVQFILFTRTHLPYNLKIGNRRGFRRSGLNVSNPTKIIIHGFQSNINEDIFVINKNAYLESGDFNVIGMDWSALCEFEYLLAIRGVQQAGKVLAEFIMWINENGVHMDDVHLVGHSLGAHVAGVGGRRVKRGKVGRITGLDPAGPGFNDIQSKLRLDSNDAKLVEVIHTYMKVLAISQPLGHIDFYPNGGRWQPGCPDIYNILQVAESLRCNHARAYYFFAETIKNKKAFKSKRCLSVDDALYSRCTENTNVHMGQSDTYNRRGLYYVRTRAKKPYNFPEENT